MLFIDIKRYALNDFIDFHAFLDDNDEIPDLINGFLR